MDAPSERCLVDNSSGELAIGLVLIAAVMTLDQASKAAAFDGAGRQIGTARNIGFFLGVGGGSQAGLIVLSVVVLGVFAFAASRTMAALGGWTLGPMLIIGGAGSNLFDRVRLGAVRDFVTAGPFIINIADVAVASGLLLTAAALGLIAHRLHTNGETVRFDSRRLRVVPVKV